MLRKFVLFVAFASASATGARAGAIPYPNAGTPNPVTYTFTAAATGDLTGYFAGSGASFDENVGVLINGVASPILINDRSAVGAAFDFGPVAKGDSLVFFDQVSGGDTYYSVSAMNDDGGNHVYSTSADAGQAYAGSPAGTYVAFEDLNFKTGSDYNYHDDTFVFTNTATVTGGVPEPSTWAMMLLGFGGIGFLAMRRPRASRCVSSIAAA